MRRTIWCSLLLLVGVCAPAFAYEYDGFGYTLRGDEHLDFGGRTGYCRLYDSSSVRLDASALPTVTDLYAYDTSRVDLAGGIPGNAARLGDWELNGKSRGRMEGYWHCSSIGVLDQSEMIVAAQSPGGSQSNVSFLHTFGDSMLRYRSGSISSLEAWQNSTIILEDMGLDSADNAPQIGTLLARGQARVSGRTTALRELIAREDVEVDLTVRQPEAIVRFAGSSHGRIDGQLSLVEVYECMGAVEMLAQADEFIVNAGNARVAGTIHDMYSNGLVSIYGGQVDRLHYTWDVDFIGKDFQVGEGLTRVDNEVMGSGWLRGQWLDGTPWETYLDQSDSEAAIHLLPEPTTACLLLAVLTLAPKRRPTHYPNP